MPDYAVRTITLMYVMSEPAISVFLLYVCTTYTVLYNDLIDIGYTAPIIRHCSFRGMNFWIHEAALSSPPPPPPGRVTHHSPQWRGSCQFSPYALVERDR